MSFHLLDKSVNVISIIFDAYTGQILSANPAACQFCGYSSQQMLQLTVAQTPLLPQDQILPLIERTLYGEPFYCLLSLDALDGKQDVTLYSIKTLWKGRAAIRVIAIDVSLSLKREKRLLLYGSAFANTGEAIVIADRHGRIEEINPAFTQISGYQQHEVIGSNMRMLQSGRHDAAFYRQIWSSIEEYGTWHGEVWNRRKSGEIYPVWLSIARISDAETGGTHYVGIMHDLSELTKTRQQLEYQGLYDGLTGLPNKVLFMQHINQAIPRANFGSVGFSLLCIHVDNYKDICNRGGTEMGDLFLQSFSLRLQKYFSAPAIMGRIRTNTLALLLPVMENHWDVMGAMRIIFTCASQPVGLGEGRFSSTVSVGVTDYPGGGENGSALMRNALMAMHKVQEECADNGYLHYSHRMRREILEQAALKSALASAVQNQELEIFYQPKVCLNTGTISGVEALLRWRKADGSFISPAEFIPVAERSDLILEIGAWVLKSACRQLKKWHDEGHGHLSVAINLSGKQFHDEQLPAMIGDILREIALPPQSLNLEITENILIDNVENAIRIMEQISAMGVHLSIDDFGRGYSSLTYLKRFPINVLKVDQSFVRDLPHGHKDVAIAMSIISLGSRLNLKVVAEGVETPEQLAFMQQHKCTEMQGFLFSKAIDAEELGAMLRSGKHLSCAYRP